MIKIFSGWSGPGGSTHAFANLTNALNECGYDTIFYGPHSYHTQLCRSKQSKTVSINADGSDYLIAHFTSKFDKFKIREDVPVKKLIYSCHECDVMRVDSIKYQIFDKIHFVSEKQKSFHEVNHPSFILPNILPDIKPNSKPLLKVGGVIGSIDRNKQTHIAINNALNDGCKLVLVYGLITDIQYFKEYIEQYKYNDNVQFMGYENDHQKIYDSVTDVYHCSISESWSYIKGECALTNTNFHGNSSSDSFWSLPKEVIVKLWLKELDYE